MAGWQLAGCSSSRQLVYFQSGPTAGDSLAIAEAFVPTVRKGDVLSVQVSSLNSQATSYFNPYTTIAAVDRTPTAGNSTAVPQSLGYLVGPDGAIEVPLLGKVTVAGMTTAQVSDYVRKQLSDYLKEPTVNVRNLNFRISVLGEVVKPSMFNVYNEQITLPEALSLAGDVTIYARRTNIMVIREVNGVRTFNRVDLTRRELFRSPFYYLHPNDVVYVEPGKARAASVDRTYQLVPIALSALSFIAIIVRRY